MPTVLIRVDQNGNGGYAVDLCVDDGDPAWLDQPRVQAKLPDVLPDSSAGDPRELLHSPGVTREVLLELGRYLHRLIHDGPVGATLAELGSDGCQHVMLDVRPDELRCLPWETMALDNDRLLFADPCTPHVRATLPFAAPGDLIDVPVRMLVLVGDTAEKLCHRKEIDSIQAGLRGAPVRWQVEVLEEPSDALLFATYDKFKPHIVHFIGHGMVASNGQPVLLVRDSATGESWRLSRFHIVNRLRQCPAPRLVVLNACRTADTSGRAAVFGVAGAFEDLGSGAVISMQGELTSPGAVRFSRVFYERLAHGGVVDVAEAAARARLEVAVSNDVNVRDWALASLSLRVEPRRVLSLRLGVSAEELRAFEARSGFVKARAFVNRTGDRRDLLTLLDPNETPLPRSEVLVVTGAEKVGKSALTQCCLLTLYVRGHQVVYVDLGGEAVNWIDALLLVNDAVATWLPATASAPCQRFRDDLPFLAAGVEPSPDAVVPLFNQGFDPRTERAEEYMNCIFSSFRTMLAAVAEEKPLILAVDRVTSATPLRHVVDGVFRPIANGELGGVRVVAVDTKDKVDLMLRDQLRPFVTCVELSRFPRAHFERLVREYCALTGRDYEGPWQDIAVAVAASGVDSWGPAMFDLLELVHRESGAER
jgi:hypothetical protein